MQVVLVYLEWFGLNSLLKCVLQAKIAKNSLKTILGVQGRLRSSMLVPLESSSAVLVMISSKSVSICNRFHARWANSGKITISKGYPSLMPSFEGNLLTQWHQNYLIRNKSPCDSPQWRFHDPWLRRFWHNTAVWQTDGQTDRRTPLP